MPRSMRQSAKLRTAFTSTPENAIGQIEGAICVARMTRSDHALSSLPINATTYPPKAERLQISY
jgi:hypothetical protein